MALEDDRRHGVSADLNGLRRRLLGEQAMRGRSKQADRETAKVAGCVGKQRHDSKTSARREQDSIKRRRKDNRSQKTAIYHCRFCGGYHVGGLQEG